MNNILVGSTLGLMGGLFMLVAGQAIIEAVDSGTYTTVIGLEVITELVAVSGAVVCVLSVLGLIFGIWRMVMSSS